MRRWISGNPIVTKLDNSISVLNFDATHARISADAPGRSAEESAEDGDSLDPNILTDHRTTIRVS